MGQDPAHGATFLFPEPSHGDRCEAKAGLSASVFAPAASKGFLAAQRDADFYPKPEIAASEKTGRARALGMGPDFRQLIAEGIRRRMSNWTVGLPSERGVREE
jgi:hypothetical protein